MILAEKGVIELDPYRHPWFIEDANFRDTIADKTYLLLANTEAQPAHGSLIPCIGRTHVCSTLPTAFESVSR